MMNLLTTTISLHPTITMFQKTSNNTIMKIQSIATATFLILFTSCSNDPEDSYPGSWITMYQEISDCPDGEQGEEELSLYSDTPCENLAVGHCQHQEITFAEGVFNYFDTTIHNGEKSEGTGSGTYMINGDTMTMCEDDECIDFLLEFDGRTMSLTGISNETFGGCTLHTKFQRK